MWVWIVLISLIYNIIRAIDTTTQATHPAAVIPRFPIFKK